MREKAQTFLLWCITAVFIFIAILFDEKMKIININAQTGDIFIYWALIASAGSFLTIFFIKIGIFGGILDKKIKSEPHHKKTKLNNFHNDSPNLSNVIDLESRR